LAVFVRFWLNSTPPLVHLRFREITDCYRWHHQTRCGV